ncbi:hypothetical protein [Salinimicrobium sp. GXAS 041]|uniref:hypothetical protein n=1 Tax=Salinimicrobium sp. GXAS 041 TaxID=3400806 RepID=UPI003C70FAF9
MSNKKKEASKSEDVKSNAKVVTTESVFDTAKAKDLKTDKNGEVEVTLIKDHGVDKKGDKLKRHPNTAQMLVDRKIAK